MLAVGGDTGKLQLWNLETRQPIGAPIPGHSSRIRSIAFSPDGTLMVVVGFNRSAIIYDVATRRPLADPLFAPSVHETIAGAAFSPDGRQLMLVDRRQQLFVLDGGFDAWATRACRIVNRNLTPEEWSRYIGDPPIVTTCPSLPASSRR